MRKQKVLFLCRQNSARSQMAQAFLRHYAGDRFEAYSAGCAPTDEIHPYAVEAMDEAGIGMGEQYPKDLKTYMGKFPGVGMRFVWVFDDPRDEYVPEEEILEMFPEVRDENEAKILY
jgi:arsenate reductase